VQYTAVDARRSTAILACWLAAMSSRTSMAVPCALASPAERS